MLDLRDPNLADLPPEWETIPAEALARLVPKAVTEVVGPSGKTHLFNTGGILTPQQKAEIDKIARARWYLLRNDGPEMERLVCKRCNTKHPYFTLACVERPFHGLQELLALLGVQGKTPTMAETLLGRYVRLGTIEPITRSKARRLIERIELRGERL